MTKKIVKTNSMGYSRNIPVFKDYQEPYVEELKNLNVPKFEVNIDNDSRLFSTITKAMRYSAREKRHNMLVHRSIKRILKSVGGSSVLSKAKILFDYIDDSLLVSENTYSYLRESKESKSFSPSAYYLGTIPDKLWEAILRELFSALYIEKSDGEAREIATHRGITQLINAIIDSVAEIISQSPEELPIDKSKIPHIHELYLNEVLGNKEFIERLYSEIHRGGNIAVKRKNAKKLFSQKAGKEVTADEVFGGKLPSRIVENYTPRKVWQKKDIYRVHDWLTNKGGDFESPKAAQKRVDSIKKNHRTLLHKTARRLGGREATALNLSHFEAGRYILTNYDPHVLFSILDDLENELQNDALWAEYRDAHRRVGNEISSARGFYPQKWIETRFGLNALVRQKFTQALYDQIMTFQEDEDSQIPLEIMSSMVSRDAIVEELNDYAEKSFDGSFEVTNTWDKSVFSYEVFAKDEGEEL